ncbi:MAG: flagellar hook-basal body complex protein FliE [Alphaproteobacteria bacterium]|nr:flagellar hook-basal body complex protein FliE [Alphaproteobacteria bacterium]
MVDQMNPAAAANLYGSMAKIGSGSSGAAKTAGQETFSDFLEKTARDSLDTMKAGEQMSAKAVTEEADLTDVVQAVSAAEITLQTVVSIRDKLVSAYQEIMRMPI